MSNIAAIQMESTLAKIFDDMKELSGDTTVMPKFSSRGINHLRDVTSFVENYAEYTFLPWVADNYPDEEEVHAFPELEEIYDNLYFNTINLLVQCGYCNRADVDTFQERFTENMPWYLDDLHVTIKIVEMLIDEKARCYA
jgi:hypothetical protein